MSALAKLVTRVLLKSTGRRKIQADLKKGFKTEKKDQPKYKKNKEQLEKDATSFARREADKAQGKKATLERVNVSQGRDKKLERKGSSKGQTELPALRTRDLKTGKISKTNKDSTANLRRQKSASRLAMGETSVKKALTESAKRKIRKTTATVGTIGGVTTATRLSQAEKPKGTRGADQRVNPKDYPKYGKKTLSAKAFRQKYDAAKANKQKTFRFEGRLYIVNAVKKQI